ncbi:cysteine desulfurase family protein [Butyrivibrio sp. MC2013]|uniref:cysteine desulfurase family protein n=1 Tax=Butyrivibrio sp. MC2013 TaxID=1280686 RepID=UPI00042A0AD7|nr:cysteine desulfurase family protein [Butyrivibrio sp. MC2013]
MECYLDNSATTRVSEDVAELALKIMTEEYGNPSSMHHMGKLSEDLVKKAAGQIAKTLHCSDKEIVFTSGGTESDNMAILGTAAALGKEVGRHMICSRVEHPAVSETMRYLEKQGWEISYLSVDRDGRIDPEELRSMIRPDTCLVSIMYVNNEIGSLMPIEEAGRVIRQAGGKIYFHVDAIQAYGKFDINPKALGIDLLSVSGHKIHAPKGTGFLYVRNGVRIVPVSYGGGQQKGMRSGTLNVPGIAALGLAAENAYKGLDEKVERLRELKALFINEITDTLEDVYINGRTDVISAPHIISLSVRGVRAEVLLHALEDRHVYVSAGSACSSNRPHVSNTLEAIGLDKELLDSTIRISLSVYTTEEEIREAVAALTDIVPMLRKYSRR